MAITVERIIEEVKTPTPEAQQQAAAFFGSGQTLQPQETTQEQERRFARHLLAIGVIDHIPEGHSEGYVDPPPIIVQGEPVLETIIRERR